MPATPSERPAPGTRRGKAFWAQVKAAYVQGTPPAAEGGEHQWPDLKAISDRFHVAYDTVRHRSSRDRWSHQRALYAAQLEREARAARIKKLARDSVAFDNQAHQLARAMMGEVVKSLTDASKRRQLRDRLLSEAGEDEEAQRRVLKDPRCRVASASELMMLSSTLSAAQRVGRLALGMPTESLQADIQATLDSEAVRAEEAAKAANTGPNGKPILDLRQDKTMMIEVAKILRGAGI